MTCPNIDPLVAIATTDLSGIARARSVTEARLVKIAETGLGWVPANLSLTPFNTIVDPNPWGSKGDIRLVPDMTARFRSARTGSATPFDLVVGDLVELVGDAWAGCSRTVLRQAAAALAAETGLSLIAAFEHEFKLFGEAISPAHSFSIGALRRVDPFGPTLMAALEDAAIEPEVMITEFGDEQFEITCAPAEALAACDRAVALREITREVGRTSGLGATFAPKTAVDGVGNGVHIHFSLIDGNGRPATYDPAGPAGLSDAAARFCAGIIRHFPAITVLTASSIPSDYRLKPHSWSSSYTWLADRDREASLRICPTVSIGGRTPEEQFNIEYRAADATANPYLSLAAIIHAGLQGIREQYPVPTLVSSDPSTLTQAERERLGLFRLPESLEAALAALQADHTVRGWFPAELIETFVGLRTHELELLGRVSRDEICHRYRALY